jgi:hypothetical protein
MATKVAMRHRDSGNFKNGYYGYSWTTFFWGPFPALFRGDILTFIVVCLLLTVIGIMTAGAGGWLAIILWGFFYNKYYTSRLLKKGYQFASNEGINTKAAAAMGCPYIPTVNLNIQTNSN